MDNIKELLLIFVKNPQKGNVKTRLAKTVGDNQALAVYQALLEHTHRITAPMDRPRQVWYSNTIDTNDCWEQGSFDKRQQSGDNLGERMQHAFQQSFNHDFQKVVLIGSDCAQLTQAVIDQAFTALDDNDVVIGPSEDGGYYLLGMRRFFGDLFAGIEWSTPTVFEETVGRVQSQGRSLELLPTLNDIDTEEDLKNSASNLAY